MDARGGSAYRRRSRSGTHRCGRGPGDFLRARALGGTLSLAFAWLAGAAAATAPARADVPAAPGHVVARAGDAAIAIGWTAAAGASGPDRYGVTLDPAVPTAEVRIVGQRAVVRGLRNDTRYRISVRGRNLSGAGPARTTSVTPRALSPFAATPVGVFGDPGSPSGIYDPSVVQTSPSDVFMAYSGVNYFTFAGLLVQDVATQLAHSTDGGRTFRYLRTLGAPDSATVTDVAGQACGQGRRCDGRFVYETPWLVRDPSDPDPARRFKLFAHKYFLYPPRQGAATVYTLGAIVMWTAPRPDGSWSAEEAVLGWRLTPPEMRARNDVNTLHPELSRCLVVTEGAATARTGVLDFAFACVEGPDTSPAPQKIVLLRSRDHARTFEYVSTPLLSQHARLLGATHFSAPSLLPRAELVPLLLATPVADGRYSGCVAVPIANETTGEVFRDAQGVPIGIFGVGPLPGHAGGACALATGSAPVLADDLTPNTPRPFGILRLDR